MIQYHQMVLKRLKYMKFGNTLNALEKLWIWQKLQYMLTNIFSKSSTKNFLHHKLFQNGRQWQTPPKILIIILISIYFYIFGLNLDSIIFYKSRPIILTHSFHHVMISSHLQKIKRKNGTNLNFTKILPFCIIMTINGNKSSFWPKIMKK